MGRFVAGLVIALLLSPAPALATTANSLSGRVVIDGVLNDYSADEWVLDASTNPAETDRDSQWGSDNDLTRVALTWDRNFLYIGVEARTFDSFLALFVSNRAGGLATLEDTGEFRRAIELPFPVNLVALAQPGRIPDVARADDAHPFGLVDRGAVSVAISGTRTGPVGFEMAVPWSMLTLSRPVRLVAAVTGEVGTGAGDVAPDGSTPMDADRFARAVLHHYFRIDADVDNDGLADIGISPRTAGSVQPGTTPEQPSDGVDATLSARPRAFAPDRGETTTISFSVSAGDPGQVPASYRVYSLDGERVRTLTPYAFNQNTRSLELVWDGRDDAGAIMRGGTYLVVAQWPDGRAKTAVVVAR
jgi:hypothetical protein